MVDDDDKNRGAIPEGVLALTSKAQHGEDFKKFDHRELSKMDNNALAAWQSKFEKDEPWWQLAEQEWQIRAGKFTRRIAIVAIIISFLSFILAGLSYWHPHH
jgi:hypothetical protein